MSRLKNTLQIWEWLLLLLCLFLFAAQAALSIQSKSATFDEEYHITRGYAYLRSGDFRLSYNHPPLVNVWSSIPLLALPGIHLPTENPSWAAANLLDFADEFMWWENDNAQQMVAMARLATIILGLILVSVMFWWARQFAGKNVGWVVLLLATFAPNLLAHSRLVTTDLGLTCFVVLTIWRLWHWLEGPSTANAAWVGLFAGAAMASKYSGLMVWPIILAILLIYPNYEPRRLKALIGMGLVAFVILWATYRFEFGPLPDSAWTVPVPIPFYLSSFWRTFADFEAVSRPAFLFGQVSDHGWWYYFPVALLVKNTVPLLLLSGLGIVPLLRLHGIRRASVLWLPFIFFMAISMTGRLSIGYRHILPAVPFLIIIAAHSVLWLSGRRMKSSRLALPVFGALLLWHMIAALTTFPDYESFFNELVGGPKNGYRVLVDSNLDWGQDLPALKQLLNEREIEDVYLSFFGTAPPESYGVRYHPIPSFPRFEKGKEEKAYNPYTPLPGWYAISATSLQLGLYLQDRNLYAYFQDKEPVAQAGHSVNLYHVQYPEDTSVKRDVVVGQAIWDKPKDQYDLLPQQRLVAKWTQTPNTTISWPPATAELPAQFQKVNVEFDDAFILKGFSLEKGEVAVGQSLAVTLAWQVENADIDMPKPIAADPLAAFFHISDPDNPSDIVAQYDGWETALAGLEVGDIILQNARIQIPEDTMPGEYLLRVGLYSPQTGQRLEAKSGAETTDFVSLIQMSIIAQENG